MNTKRIAIAALALLWSVCASGRLTIFEIRELAAEVHNLVLTGSARQLLYVRDCDQCQSVTVSVTPSTVFFDHETPVDATRAAGLADRDATVFYDAETREVTRIVFWKKVTS